MEEILEIRDGCSTPEQLLKSLTFARYLKIYKTTFIKNLESRPASRQHEAQPKIEFIKSVKMREIVAILDHSGKNTRAKNERDRDLVRFLDGAFHHYRGSAYSRLVRLQNSVVANGKDTPESVKDKITRKAQRLSKLILKTRRRMLQKVGLDMGVRRTQSMTVPPNVTAGEISGHYLNLPADYVSLAYVPLTIAADIQTGVNYNTPSNKRALPFYELAHNPFKSSEFDPEQWVSVALQVGASLIVAYLHKSRGCIEMEAGLLNLFPFGNIEELQQGRRPDGVFIFGDPNARDEDLGYYWDDENQLLVGTVPNRDPLKYFGYAKKPILTLHNVLAIRNGEIPLHCGCTRYVMRFGEKSGAPYIADMLVKADDMGRVVLETDEKDTVRPIFYGTETGAFACLDGFSEQAKLLMQGREVGYNQATGSNARQIVPVAEAKEVQDGDVLDILLYMNNFTLIEEDGCTISIDMSVDEAIDSFRLGERVAAGSTQTHRGSKESSYWANPFPLLQDGDGKVLHPDLYEKFQENETLFIAEMKNRVNNKEMILGVAYSQLMAGAYKDNGDEDITRCGYANREEVEQKAPVRLAEDLIGLIKEKALDKRKRSGGKIDQVSITVALVGDSRTGKSETAEKMEGILSLQLI
ncbi:hypothetical protein [Candidatus Venteria ishoeyi]|uniref:Uncharacterized protein n=1 Tax=Candidatus Venteria ishoeyi TaxID=1899563 RepID=A0A1H6FG37_9GAMM|nr:hypothetical protein [Candidatus Venteria ishoeyi]MDM8546728.1 hypothetical protein [Candidatus Venteria ishoeyi]SEH08613.1 Uncharacterised protein [Candidatus Venteria ishoeyi]